MIRATLLACVVLGVTLIGLLFRASSNNTFFSSHYPWLLGVGVALIVGLLALIGYQIHSLWRKLRGRVFGAKLALRLMAVFVLMAVIPGGLVYAISVQFLNRSIDSWFDVPVEKAFESALNLGKSAIDTALSELARKAEEAASRIGETSGEDTAVLSALRKKYALDEISMFAADGQLIAFSGGRAKIFADKPTRDEVKETLQKRPLRMAESQTDRSLFLRVAVPVQASRPFEPPRVLQIVQAAPKTIAADAASVEAGIRDYQQLGLQREGLKQLFALTLTLAMLLTLFSAISLSFLLSDRLSAPLSALADSTRAIAKGDFTKLNPVKSRDEFGVLTQAFNTMTRQLAGASEIVGRKQQELEHANAYLESILGNLTSGVIALDERLYVKTINKNAEDMLGIAHHALKGMKISDWGSQLPALAPFIEDFMAQLASLREKPWERQVDYESPAAREGATGRKTLLVRGTKLPAALESGFVLVLDDITGLIQAQRNAAWGEVARRLAHEIKNPLTPIQLSAERLQHKLSGKLPQAEQELLQRATNTIVAQVGALKSMVDDFSLYSRSTRMTPTEVNLNDLINDVMALYESMNVAIELKLGEDIPPITADASLLRQVIHNLAQNALDALTGLPEPRIVMQTGVHDGLVRFSVEDNGTGVREDVLGRIFEPYITTKPKGTGLGMAIAKKIIEEHQGSVTVVNVKPHGALVEILLPVSLQIPRNSTG
ncbi:MAG: HAMP domain-containing protein [Burkholderiales bacterium]|nr:HAMP domain-containing protein [Burkholderiales bacterium]